MTDPAVPYQATASTEESVQPVTGTEVTSVPLMAPRRVYEDWGPAAERDLLRILRSHAYVKGEHVEAFEREFAEYVGTTHAVAVDSCTDALWVVVRAILDEAPEGRREVILPTFTFVATAGAVVNAGGRPVFADVEIDTHNIDPESVAGLVSERTAAVIPVHLFGSPADVNAVREATHPHEVKLVEDAAQAVHATHGARRAGALCDAATFSFYPSKNLGAAGDGGIVTTDDEQLAVRISALRDHGQHRKLYDHDMVGTNSRMDEIQASVLRHKLPCIDAWTQGRRAIAARYDLAFQGTTLEPQRVLPGCESAYHLYTVRVPNRDAVRQALKERGIATGVYYPLPLHRQSCFAKYEPDDCPVADRLAGEVLSLPCFPGLTRAEQDLVIETVRDVVAADA